MPILIQWDNEDETTIHCVFTDPWTWEEFEAMVEQTDVMIESASSAVIDMIFDLTDGQRLPGNALGQFRKLSRKETPKLGVIILVRVSTFMQLIGDILDKLYPNWTKRIRLVRTIDEAHALLPRIQNNRQEKL
ncbi:MAG: hypothetical protein K8L97_18990 [Anaerolineae bacterium]|nr:hypothetical protein [Anaerolineae bacterium]